MSHSMNRRKFLQLSGFTAAGTMLAACVAPTAPAAEPAAESEEAAPMAEEITIQYVHLSNTEQDMWHGVLKDDFEASTDYKVELIPSGWPVRETVLPLLAAGTPPDCAHAASFGYPQFYIDGTYLNLDDIFDASGYTRDMFAPGDLDSVSFNGQLMEMPIAGSNPSQMLMYRKDFYDEAGLPYPEELKNWGIWEDMLAESAELVQTDDAGNVTRWGLDLLNPNWSGDWMLGAILDMGQHWWDAENQEFQLTADKTIEAVQRFYLDPVFKFGVSFSEETRPEVARNDRLSEGVAAISLLESALRRAKQQENMEMYELIGWSEQPGLAPGVHHTATVGPGGIGIISAAPQAHLPASSKFIFTQFKDETQRRYMDIFGTNTAILGWAGQDPYVQSLLADGEPLALFGAAKRAQYAEGLNNFYGWAWGDFGNAYFMDNRELQQELLGGTIWSGTVTAAQLCEAWQDVATKGMMEFKQSAGIEVIT
ncbi:MAG: extracellular solute-binding protein [Caldilineaceae bacterium]|nr:extracellular solute-binding protein [Caldilineaceae bacterium]MCY4119033.1 extracellular solute-binding protein [Caldilineaceae bacterium]MDE0068183.1 extracellular solute-binding protein [Caldilineaceae bacterium]MDE0181881.1 extracellular solute-binding protein [Caldilineaceae bacterium]MDE0431595.1 extracellular solute-binding protein [Caldilineaceae bacterium]